VEWVGEFFRAMPDVFQALYRFGDPQDLGRGWVGGLITLLWLVGLGVVPLYLAKLTYGKHEWVSATMGVMGASSLLWWIHGVFPHGWIQFTESNQDLLAGTVIPGSFGIQITDDYYLDIASNLYAVITEGVVGALMIGGIVVTLWGLLRMQKDYPKTLAPGETKPEAGGYK
jgi:hypothetical protein